MCEADIGCGSTSSDNGLIETLVAVSSKVSDAIRRDEI